MATMPGTLVLSALLALLGPPTAVPSASWRYGFPSGKFPTAGIAARNLTARAPTSQQPVPPLVLYALQFGLLDPPGSQRYLASENRFEHCSDPYVTACGHCAPAAPSRADPSPSPDTREALRAHFWPVTTGGSTTYFDPLNNSEYLPEPLGIVHGLYDSILVDSARPRAIQHQPNASLLTAGCCIDIALRRGTDAEGMYYSDTRGAWSTAIACRALSPVRVAAPRRTFFGFPPPLWSSYLLRSLHELYGELLLTKGQQPTSRAYRRALAHRQRRSHRVTIRYLTPSNPPVALRRRFDVKEYRNHHRLPCLQRQAMRAMRRQALFSTHSVGMPYFDPPTARSVAVRMAIALWSPCTTASLHALRLYAWMHFAIGSLWSYLEPVAFATLLNTSDLLRRLVDRVVDREAYADAHRAAWHMLFELATSRPLQHRWRRLNVARRAYASSKMDNLQVCTALVGCMCLRVSCWCIRRLMQDSRVTDVPESVVVAHTRLLIRREANAACAGRHILLCGIAMMGMLRDSAEFMLNSKLALSTGSLVLLPLVAGGDDMASSSRPPFFDGTRAAFLAWLMAFSGYVSWKLTECVDMMDDEPPTEPTVPELVATTDEAEGNEEEVEAATERRDNWLKRNRRLYGLLMQAVPDWLRTSLYNQHRNNGIASLDHLRRSFDVVDANDHAACIARLQTSYIDPKNDIREEDLRAQFDGMQVATAGIVRSGHTAPPDATLKAMFDNALPIAYAQIRQLVRRSNHNSFIAHYADYVAQVRAELSSRAPIAHAFTAGRAHSASFLPSPPPASGHPSVAPSAGHGTHGNPGGTASRAKICLRCGAPGHLRPECRKDPVRCTHCGADHLSDFCEKSANRRQRARLSRGAANLIKRDTKAARTRAAAAHTAVNDSPDTAQASDFSDRSTARANSAAATSSAEPPVRAVTDDPASSAHAQSYAAALRTLGFCATTKAKRESPSQPLPPPHTNLQQALTDTMATFWIVPTVTLLWRVDNPSPEISISTADGLAQVKAVGTALVHLRVGDQWECFEVPNVLVLPNCTDVLYSTRVMRDCFNLAHDLDNGVIRVPGAADIEVQDDGSAFSTPAAFARPGSARPTSVHLPVCRGRALAAPIVNGAAIPEAVADAVGTLQTTLYQRLGFPYAEQWRLVPSTSTGHGLAPNTRVATDLPMREAVARGRSRALPFSRSPATPQPPPGAVFYMDFAGPMIASRPHRFVCYCGLTDAGSGYGRCFPGHGMTATLASSSLSIFIADVASKMGLDSTYKPHIVRSDQGSAFVSREFREFAADNQINLSLAATYTPQQNSHIERFWGTIFGTGRVLLAAANLPPSLHPFAIQAAAWLANRLPRPSRANKSPFELLSHTLPDFHYLYTFGCLCTIVTPPARRVGDRHFADRGEHGLYLGPSEESPASVVYLLSSRRVTTVAKLKVWEDQFPGIDGKRHHWVIDHEQALQQTATDEASPILPLPPPASLRPAPDDHGPARLDETAPTPNAPLAPSPPAVPSRRSAAPRTDASPLPRPDLNSRAGPSGPVEPVPYNRPYDRHPQADDPSSRHYERVHPSRSRRNPDRLHVEGHRSETYGSAAFMLLPPPVSTTGTAFAHALAVYALLNSSPRYSICCSAIVDPLRGNCTECGNTSAPANGAPSVRRATRPVTAWSSACTSVDDAFANYSRHVACDEPTALIAAAFAAGHAATITLTKDMGDLAVPKGYRQARTSPQSSYWREAITKEIRGLLQLGTWEYVPLSSLPPGSNIMNCHYVFTIKRRHDGSIEKFKARLVADGNSQKHGIDFDRVFATVVKTLTIRLILILAAARGYNLSSIDITQAYLQASLNEDLYMRVPPGIHVGPDEQDLRGFVCKLKRSLYGLKQAGREWATLFAKFLMDWGMKRSTIDVCLYVYCAGAIVLWVAIYVDDALIADNDSATRDRFVADLSKRFPTEDKGALKWILNVEIARDRARRVLTMSQELYIQDLLAKFSDDADGAFTRHFDSPLDENVDLSPDCDSPEVTPEQREKYMSIVGGLLWLANMTRYDIAYASSQLSRVLTRPKMVHFRAALRVLIYLRGSKGRLLTFAPSESRHLDSFVDSNWATKFSCSGAMFLMHGCLFHWFSKMQRSVTLSSAEAEYFGAMLAARELMFIRELLHDLGCGPTAASAILCDSKSAVDMAFDPVAFKKTKHILRAAEFLRDLVTRDVISMSHVSGAVMIADIFTKPVARPLFVALLELVDNYAERGLACPSDAAAAAPASRALRPRGGGGGDGSSSDARRYSRSPPAVPPAPFHWPLSSWPEEDFALSTCACDHCDFPVFPDDAYGLCDFCWEISCTAHDCACICYCDVPDDGRELAEDDADTDATDGNEEDEENDLDEPPPPPSPGIARLRGGGSTLTAATGAAAGATVAVGLLGLAFLAWRSLAARASPVRTFADKPHVDVRRTDGCGLGLFARCDMEVGTAVVSMDRPVRVYCAVADARAVALELPPDSFIVVVNQRPSAFCDFSWIDPDAKPAWYYMNHAGRAFANVEMTLRRHPLTHALHVVWVACVPIASGSELRYAYGGAVPRDWALGAMDPHPPSRPPSSSARSPRRRSRPAAATRRARSPAVGVAVARGL